MSFWRQLSLLSNSFRRSNQKTQVRQIAQAVLAPYLVQADTSAVAKRTLAWLELRDRKSTRLNSSH